MARGTAADRMGLGCLRRGRKGSPIKVRLARKLRRETTMALQWIGDRDRSPWTREDYAIIASSPGVGPVAPLIFARRKKMLDN